MPELRDGLALRARYKGQEYEAIVIQGGDKPVLEFAGQQYSSLTAMARAVTGGPINGRKFWRVMGIPIDFQRPVAEVDEPDTAAALTETTSAAAIVVQDNGEYMPQPDKDGSYPTTNPKLGPRPDWFKDSNCWTMQCPDCDLIVVARTHGKSFFDDYHATVPHECTHRKPGETIEQAQRRLDHRARQRQAKKQAAEEGESTD